MNKEFHESPVTESLERKEVFEKLLDEVISPGICTHCGTCVGLSHGKLQMTDTPLGPIPTLTNRGITTIPTEAYYACPGKGLNYPELNQFLFNKMPDNWLIGNVRRTYVGYAKDEEIRRQGASGGVISQTLIFLLENKLIDGAIVLCNGQPEPWQATPIIARHKTEVLKASQSVYIPVPVNTILSELENLNGRFAFVGLPDQVASIRKLQQLGNPIARKIVYLLGIYFGTSMYFNAIESFLRSQNIDKVNRIKKLSYRAGEWPGYLEIITADGRVIRASKFYYNYLIPFYITRSSLLSVDFTNELADFSVGDAWHPSYEKERKGFSVVLTRTERGLELLEKMNNQDVLVLEEKPLEFVLSMHGHMIDFKKRGAFIRMSWRKRVGGGVPEYGYHPTSIPTFRYIVELVISGLFLFGRTTIARRVVEIIPVFIIGPFFNFMRKTWKSLSKPTKRKGLANYDVRVTSN